MSRRSRVAVADLRRDPEVPPELALRFLEQVASGCGETILELEAEPSPSQLLVELAQSVPLCSRTPCPSPVELDAFVTDYAELPCALKLAMHVAGCAACLSVLDRARASCDWEAERAIVKVRSRLAGQHAGAASPRQPPDLSGGAPFSAMQERAPGESAWSSMERPLHAEDEGVDRESHMQERSAGFWDPERQGSRTQRRAHSPFDVAAAANPTLAAGPTVASAASKSTSARQVLIESLAQAIVTASAAGDFPAAQLALRHLSEILSLMQAAKQESAVVDLAARRNRY